MVYLALPTLSKVTRRFRELVPSEEWLDFLREGLVDIFELAKNWKPEKGNGQPNHFLSFVGRSLEFEFIKWITERYGLGCSRNNFALIRSFNSS